MEPAALPGAGVEWIVDAHGCDPARLRSVAVIERLFAAIVEELRLTPLGAPRFHAFPGEGGVTGLLMLSESHLTCHTFPEAGYAALDLYCCRPREPWRWEGGLVEALGAARVHVRALDRPAGCDGGAA